MIYTDPKMHPVRDPDARPEDYLRYKHILKERKLEILKKQHEERILEECNNFMPRINPKSRYIAQVRSGGEIEDPSGRG